MLILRMLQRHSKEIVFYTVLAIVVCFVLFPEKSFELLTSLRTAFVSMMAKAEEESEGSAEEEVNA